MRRREVTGTVLDQQLQTPTIDSANATGPVVSLNGTLAAEISTNVACPCNCTYESWVGIAISEGQTASGIRSCVGCTTRPGCDSLAVFSAIEDAKRVSTCPTARASLFQSEAVELGAS